MTDNLKITIIWNWLSEPNRYKNGVTNNEVIKEFGDDYKDAWKSLKAKKKSMFFEDKKWYKWTN